MITSLIISYYIEFEVLVKVGKYDPVFLVAKPCTRSSEGDGSFEGTYHPILEDWRGI
jgi:hypothetical protein